MKYLLTDEPSLRSLIRSEVERAIEASFQAHTPQNEPVQRFSQRQAARRYGISEPTLIKWRKQGKLHGDIVNGRIFYTAKEMERVFRESEKQ
ncbi:MAG: helix-turn-helix domain-containing protein [Bacteroidales bacterium]